MITNEMISPCFENGVFTGVHVTLWGEDFVIVPKDYNGSKGFAYGFYLGHSCLVVPTILYR